jgi:hypothetical protein
MGHWVSRTSPRLTKKAKRADEEAREFEEKGRDTMPDDWWLQLSPGADDTRWRPHHIRAGERVELTDTRTGHTRIDYVAVANPRFLCFSDGLAFDQPQEVLGPDGDPIFKQSVPVPSNGNYPRFTLRRAP